jgi:hypothetical protein
VAPFSKNQIKSKCLSPPRSVTLSGNSGHSDHKLKQKIIDLRDSLKIPKIRNIMQHQEILSRSRRSSKSQGSKGSHGSYRGKMNPKRLPVQKERLTFEWPDINSLQKTVQISPKSKDIQPPQESTIEYLENPPRSISVPMTFKQPRSKWVRSEKRKVALNWETKI